MMDRITDNPGSTRLDGLGRGLLIADADGRVAFVNDVARRLLGYGPETVGEALIGADARAVFECGEDEPQRSAGSPIDRVIETGESLPCVKGHVQRAGGGYIPAVAEFGALLADGAHARGVVVAFTVVGSSELAATATGWDDAFGVGVFNALPGPFFVFDAAGRMLWWNRASEVISGYGSSQISAMHPVEFFTSGSRPSVERAIVTVVDAGQAEVEAEVQTADGRILPYRFAATRMALGDQWVVVGTGIDISERKAIEKALRESEQQFRAVFERAALGIAVVSEDGYPYMVNPALARMLGRDAESLSAMRFDEFTHREDIEADWTLYSEMVTGCREGYQLEKRFVRADGRVVWGRLNVSRLPGHGPAGQPAMLAMVEDITERKRTETELRRNQQRLADAQRIAGLGNWEWDVATGALWWSDETYRMFGRSREAFSPTYQGFLDAVHPNDRSLVENAVEAALAGQPYSLDHRIVRPDGVERVVHEQGEVVLDEHGHPSSMRGTVQDVTERRELEATLRRSAKVFESTHEGILVTDDKGDIVAVNQAFTDITGYSEDEVIGKNPSILQSGQQDEAFYRAMWKAVNETGGWQGEIWNRRKDGNIYPQWLTISTVTDESGRLTNYVGVFSDITRIKQSQQELEHLAHHDPLTDLPNRLLFRARLEHAMARAKREGQSGAVVVLDLDEFKHVNDSLGHSVGDELLKVVAARLTEALRADDTVARMGGDEFLIVMEGLEAGECAEVLVERVTRALAQPVELDEAALSISSSIGISLYPQDGEDVEVLLKNADAAMYRAKEQGRNTYRFYSEEMTREAYDRVVLRGELRRALSHDELALHYQPQVDIGTGRVVGVEALVRWEHPERGTIPPARFIRVAEASGLIVPLGDWVIRSACQQARRWLDAGVDFGCIAVNVSAVQFHRSDLLDTVRTVLADTGLPAERLELEVTETGLMQLGEGTEELLDGLRSLGISLAIDDFGTGYSSLGYLKRLAFDRLKIDKSFVDGLPGDEHDVGITRAIIGIANALGLSVVAEGVETDDQRAFLERAGVVCAQGFLWAKPTPDPSFHRFQPEAESRRRAAGN